MFKGITLTINIHVKLTNLLNYKITVITFQIMKNYWNLARQSKI